MYNTTPWREACERAEHVSVRAGRAFISVEEDVYRVRNFALNGLDVVAKYENGKRVEPNLAGRPATGVRHYAYA